MQSFLPMLLFAFATSITPGPNNTLLMITSANWGFRASLPVFLGVVCGFLLMVFAVGVGLGEAFTAWPALHAVLKWVCFAWLLVIAWKIARAGGPAGSSGGSGARPLTFFEIAAFQWVNPKAWMMAIGAVALYVPPNSDSLAPALRVVLAFALGGAPCILAWSLFGLGIARFLTSPLRMRIFNVSLAILLVLSMLPTLF